MKPESPDAGRLLSSNRLLSLNVSINVAREQFSDMLRMLEANWLKDLHFTVGEGADGSWPVHRGGIQVKQRQTLVLRRALKGLVVSPCSGSGGLSAMAVCNAFLT
jgi:hypothetical protein